MNWAQKSKWISKWNSYNICLQNTIYFGTYENGLWESTDGGQTFTQNTSIPIVEPTLPSGNFNIQPIYAYNDVVYVAIHAGTKSDGLWESFNNGKTFTKNTSIPNWASPSLEQIYAYKGVLYAETDGGLWESTDNGQHFTENTYSLLFQGGVEQVYGYNNVVYLLSGQVLYESKDNGKTFTRNNFFASPTDPFAELIYAFNNVVYVGALVHGLYQSTDNGTTFSQNKIVPKDADVSSMFTYNNILYITTLIKGIFTIPILTQ